MEWSPSPVFGRYLWFVNVLATTVSDEAAGLYKLMTSEAQAEHLCRAGNTGGQQNSHHWNPGGTVHRSGVHRGLRDPGQPMQRPHRNLRWKESS